MYSEVYATTTNNPSTQNKNEDSKQSDKIVRFKGISFKANLLKKHTDFYEKQMKKLIEKNISPKLTPKVSKIEF